MMKRNRIFSLLLILCLTLSIMPAVMPQSVAAAAVPYFEVQPKTIYVPEGGTAELTFSLNIDPEGRDDIGLYLVQDSMTWQIDGHFADPAGNAAAPERDMTVVVGSSWVSDMPYRIRVQYRDAGNAVCSNTSELFYINPEPKFVKQPNSIYLDDIGDPDAFKAVSWEINFTPHGEFVFLIRDEDGKRGGPSCWGIADLRDSSSPIFLDASYISSDPYYIWVNTKDGAEYFSEPFYVLRKGSHVFERQPEDVVILDGMPAEVSWKVDYFPEPYTQTWNNYVDATFWLTGGPIGFHQSVKLISAYRYINGDNHEVSIEEDRDMSITIDADWVCDKPYQIAIIEDDAPQIIRSKSFRVREAWTVSFRGNEYGQSIPDQHVITGERAMQPVVPSRNNGYVFGGWYTDPDFTELYDFSTPVTGTLTLYARWDLMHYEVSFDTGGGTPTVIRPQIIGHGGTVTRPAEPTREGGVFAGWYTDPEFAHIYDFGAPVTCAMTLFAKWDMQTFLVSFNSRGIGTSPPVQTVTYGETAAEPPEPTAANYIFGGWFKNGGFAEENRYDFSEPVMANTNLNAKWTKICTLSFSAEGGTGSMSSVQKNQGQSFTLPACGFTAPEGKRFKYWASGGSYFSAGRTITVTDDMVFRAVWDNIPYRRISFDMNGFGEQADTMFVELNTVPAGPPSDPAADGRTFTGWYTTKQAADRGAAGYLFDFSRPLTDDVTLYAGWRDNSRYTIHLSICGSGYGSASLRGTGLEQLDSETYTANPGVTVFVENITPAAGSITGEAEWGRDWIRAGNTSIGNRFNKDFTMPAGDIYVDVHFTALPVDEGGHLHNEDTLVHCAEQPHSCTVDGCSEHWECPICGQWFYINYRGEFDSVYSKEAYIDRHPGHMPGALVFENEIPATCTEAGFREKMIYCTVCGEELMTREFEDVPATGHAWGVPEYVWADDYSSVTATAVCQNDECHVISETSSAYLWDRNDASCFENEWSIFRAEEFNDPIFEPQMEMVVEAPALGHDWDGGRTEIEPTCDEDGRLIRFCTRCECVKTENIPALGHNWDTPSYTWSGDNTVTAAAVCRTDGSHTVTETVTSVYSVLTPAGCTTGGIGIRTAAFSGVPFTEQVLAVPISAPGHDWDEPEFVWSDDFGSAFAVFTCRRDSDHSETVIAEVSSETTVEPTVDSEGRIAYTAAVLMGGREYTDTLEKTLPAIGLAITSQPEDFSGQVGDEVSFTVEAIGRGLSYQWQYSSDGGAHWGNSGLPGNKTATLTTTLTEARLVYRFRCVVTDGSGKKLNSDIVRMIKR
jgi:uncharacterized repeat protein (TIGR02543 family)